ncbi:MAG: LLM class flavin-dependent oxidoreductase [Actinobacteria bacterium]|nr:LLM class flavin-dependent oxidoreductase [Actinomycetota bacterium]
MTTAAETVPGGRAMLGAGHRLKLGLFGFNCTNGLSLTTAETGFSASWDETLEIARMADRIGMDLLIPIARWRGLGGDTDPFRHSFETMTWAAGIAAGTERISVVSTLHLPLTHPVAAAKQCVTIDHIAHGRYAFNAVMGWFAPDMTMFGTSMREHDDRYRYGAEWMEIVRRIWTEEEPFDFDGEYFQLSEVQAHPKPWQDQYPMLINAGNSAAGMDFAARDADVNFVHVESLETGRAYIEKARAHARDKYQRELSFMGIGFVVCRESEAEARRVATDIIARGDRAAARSYLTEFGLGSESLSDDFIREAEDKAILGMGARQLVGTPDQVAEGLAELSEIGLDGVMLAFLDYEAELGAFAETVLPRLEERGLRLPIGVRA